MQIASKHIQKPVLCIMMPYLILVLSGLLTFQKAGNQDEWVLIEPPGVGASVEMPTVPRFKEQVIRPVRDLDEIVVKSRSSVLGNGNTNLTFVYHDEQVRPSGRNQISKVLDGAITGAIALVNGELIEQEEIFVGSNKGRDFVYSCEIKDMKLQLVQNLKIRSQIILVGRRLYSMNYISVLDDYDDGVADRFFTSFQLINVENDLPPKPRLGRAKQLAEEYSEEEMESATSSKAESEKAADSMERETGEEMGEEMGEETGADKSSDDTESDPAGETGGESSDEDDDSVS